MMMLFVHFCWKTLVITLQQEKRLQACLRKHRQRVHIEEVDNSSDDEESKDIAVPCSKKVSLANQAG